MRRFPLSALLIALLAMPAMALDLGDKAPEISVETWVTGEPADPTAADGKTIYLVEVWSVSCPPCVLTIPMLNDLQKRYADQGFKVVSFTSDALGDVKTFLGDHPMEYSSFIDKDGDSMVNYMAADNRNTIPHAFLFDRDGALVWTGNPLDNLESKLKQVIDGTLTREKALAVREARDTLQSAFSAQDLDGMIAALRDLETIEPDNGQYYQVHYRIITEFGMGEENDVRELLNAWYKGCQDQAESLMVLSVVALDQGPPNFRNPELALAAAKRAYAIDSPSRMEAGLNLAESYKNIGRPDLSLELVRNLSGEVPTESIETAAAIESFYSRLIDLGKNPYAEYAP